MKLPETSALFNLEKTKAAPLLKKCRYPWEALPAISDFILSLQKELPTDEYDCPTENVYIHKTAKVDKSAHIDGPTIIGAKTEVRPGAFIRGSALIGEGAVIGNSSEVKNAIIFDGVQIPHYNYVGDSILGHLAHMGAGCIASNIRSDRKNLVMKTDEERVETGLRKIGTFLGDGAEIGCNSVLCPASIVGKGSIVYPLSRVRGVVPPKSIYKGEGNIVPIKD